MPWYSVGPSSYPDLKGQTQYVNSDRIAAQFLSICRDYAAKFGADGDRLSANEARRTRPRQQELYANFLHVGYPKAALPYTSRHDELTHGNAIDVGVTMADGRNRALTDEEFAWMHTAAESRGFTWTGRYFNEPWHIEGATRLEVFPPYPRINIDNAAPKPDPKPTPTTTPVGDIVNTIIVRLSNGKGGYDSFLANADTMKCLHLGSGTQETFWKNVGVKQISGNQPKPVLAGFEQVKGEGGVI